MRTHLAFYIYCDSFSIFIYVLGSHSNTLWWFHISVCVCVFTGWTGRLPVSKMQCHSLTPIRTVENLCPMGVCGFFPVTDKTTPLQSFDRCLFSRECIFQTKTPGSKSCGALRKKSIWSKMLSKARFQIHNDENAQLFQHFSIVKNALFEQYTAT